MSTTRVLRVTFLLFVLGALVGALLGLGLALVVLSIQVPHNTTYSAAAARVALMGAVLGAVLAPVAAWTLMRHVPLWRAIAETALGTVIGGAIGLVVVFDYTLIAAIGGFGLAALRLRLRKSSVTQEPLLDHAG